MRYVLSATPDEGPRAAARQQMRGDLEAADGGRDRRPSRCAVTTTRRSPRPAPRPNRIVEEARAAAEARARPRRCARPRPRSPTQRQAAMAELDAARAVALRPAQMGDVAELAVAAASKVVQADLDVAGNQAHDRRVREPGRREPMSWRTTCCTTSHCWPPKKAPRTASGSRTTSRRSSGASLAFLIVAVPAVEVRPQAGGRRHAERIDAHRDELDAAAEARTAAEAERDRIKAALADSDSEAARIVEEARRSADALDRRHRRPDRAPTSPRCASVPTIDLAADPCTRPRPTWPASSPASPSVRPSGSCESSLDPRPSSA